MVFFSLVPRPSDQITYNMWSKTEDTRVKKLESLFMQRPVSDIKISSFPGSCKRAWEQGNEAKY